MSQNCEECGKIQYRCRIRNKKKIGVDCGCLRIDHSADNVNDPYSGLVLEHLKDKEGNSVRVDNLRQMSKVEQEFGVVHAVTSYGENWMPPEKPQPTFKDLYRPLRERGRRPI